MNARTRRRVRDRAENRCEYCLIHEDDEPYTFHLEHIIPKKHDGSDSLANLAWSCQSCNLFKGDNLSGWLRGQIVALFHPRRQRWHRHFRIRGALITAKTKCGQATVRVLRLNAEDRVQLRRLLIIGGTFPPPTSKPTSH